MELTHDKLLEYVSLLRDTPPSHLKAVKVTPEFYNYLAARYKNDVIYKYQNSNILMYCMGIPVIVDDTISDKHYALELEFEEG